MHDCFCANVYFTTHKSHIARALVGALLAEWSDLVPDDPCSNPDENKVMLS